MDLAIQAVGLTKQFRGRAAVNGVDLLVRPGTIHGLLGPNGAGKTTVLRILLGLVRPDSGAVVVAGRTVLAHHPAAGLGIAGFVETPSFYPYLTVRQNLELLAGLGDASAGHRVRDLIDEVGLRAQSSSKARTLSTGMRQRLGLAAALINDPAVLVVDEPTTGLDPAGIRDLHGLLHKWREAGRTVLLSSHDLGEVEQLCDEVTVLRSGRVVYAGTINALQGRTARRSFRLVTTDDAAAAAAAAAERADGLQVTMRPTHLDVRGEQENLDRYVIALARAGIAVRELSHDQLPLDSLFFQLTEESLQTTEESLQLTEDGAGPC